MTTPAEIVLTVATLVAGIRAACNTINSQRGRTLNPVGLSKSRSAPERKEHVLC